MQRTRWSVLFALLVLGCGSSSSNPDATAPASEAGAVVDSSMVPPDSATVPVDGSSVQVDSATVSIDSATALIDASAVQSVDAAGMPAAGFCTSKPVLPSVTDLSGVWVAKLIGAQIVKNGLTKDIHNQNVYFQLLTLKQTGASVSLDGTYCDRTEVGESVPLVPKVLIPDAWAHTETPVHRTGDFSAAGGGSAVLSLPASFEAIGANLASAQDALPTSPTDPRVRDDDNDGNPGITIRLSGTVSGSLYSAQTQVTSVLAIAVAADRLEGALAFTSNQTVLASNPASIKDLYASSKTVPDTATCSSTFAMVKVGAVGATSAPDGSALNCAWVRAKETTLFQ